MSKPEGEQLPQDRRASIPQVQGTIHGGVTVEGLIEFTQQVLIVLDGRGARGNRKRAGAAHHDRDQAAFMNALLRVNEVEVVDGRDGLHRLAQAISDRLRQARPPNRRIKTQQRMGRPQDPTARLP